MSEDRPRIRVLVAKPGLDGHDRGAKVIARALSDAGCEVIYTGIRQTPQMIAEVAVQEDVSVVGLSILSGAHLTLAARVMSELQRRGAGDAIVVVGGIVSKRDVAKLKELGIAEVFGPGTTTTAVVASIRALVAERAGHPASAS
jgi:methylmalonyl-CoA mutase C-terminal domain/subunit